MTAGFTAAFWVIYVMCPRKATPASPYSRHHYFDGPFHFFICKDFPFLLPVFPLFLHYDLSLAHVIFLTFLCLFLLTLGYNRQ